MKLCLLVILFNHVVHTQADDAVMGLVGEQVILPCIYKGQASLLLQNIYFNWQIQSNQVVYAFDKGKHQPTVQADRFKNRTVVSRSHVENGNLSLQISRLTLADEGLYTCYLFTKVPERTKIFHSNVQLQVAAPFNTPEIVKVEAIPPGEEVNLTCRSSGGFPKPTVDWMDGEGKPLLGNWTVVKNFVSDPVNGLWNVTSVLQVRVARNSSYTCSVHNNWTRETVTSVIWMAPHVPTQQTEGPGRGSITAVCVLVAVIVSAVLFTFCCLGWRKIRASEVTADAMENHTGAESFSTEMQNLSGSRGRKKTSPEQGVRCQPAGASSTEGEEEEEMIAHPDPNPDQR